MVVSLNTATYVVVSCYKFGGPLLSNAVERPPLVVSAPPRKIQKARNVSHEERSYEHNGRPRANSLRQTSKMCLLPSMMYCAERSIFGSVLRQLQQPLHRPDPPKAVAEGCL